MARRIQIDRKRGLVGNPGGVTEGDNCPECEADCYARLQCVERAKRRDGDAGMLTVFVLRNGTATPVRIRVGASDADSSIVTGGALKAGDAVITADSAKDAKKKGGGFGPPGTGGNPKT